MKRLAIIALLFLCAAYLGAQPLVRVKDIIEPVMAVGTMTVTNTDFPDAATHNKLDILISTTTGLFRAGELIGNTHFDVSDSTINAVLLNAPTDYPDALGALFLSAILQTLDNDGVVLSTTQVADLKNVMVQNFPSSFTITGDISGSTVAVSNFPSDYLKDGGSVTVTGAVSVNNFPTIYDVSGSSVHVSNQISGYATESTLAVLDGKIVEANTKDVAITSGTLSVDNFPSDYLTEGGTVAVSNLPTDYATETTLAEVRDGLKAVAVTSGTISVDNLPSVYNTTGSTVTMIQRDTRDYHFALRNAPDQADRYLRVNTYNGLDIRLHNNAGTLISTTAPLPMSDYSVWSSSYTETESTGTIKSGATDIVRVVIGTRGVGSQIIIRDGISGAAPIVATIDTGANASVPSVELGLRLATGLYIEAIGATPAKLTIVYR